MQKATKNKMATVGREWGKYHTNVNTIVPTATSPSRAEWRNQSAGSDGPLDESM